MANRGTYYWEDFVDDQGKWRSERRPPGEDLAALRRGLGREAGTVPSMWRFHRTELGDAKRSEGFVNNRFVAEHYALTLYGVHQQSQKRPMHHRHVGVGEAMRTLHGGRGEDAAPAIDRRFYAMVTSDTVDEAAHHLRGLVQLLRSKDRPVALDYTLLVRDLTSWAAGESRDRIRRKWGLQYHAPPARPDDQDEPFGHSTDSLDSATAG